VPNTHTEWTILSHVSHSVAVFRERLLDFGSCWIVFICVVRGRPGGLLQLSKGEQRVSPPQWGLGLGTTNFLTFLCRNNAFWCTFDIGICVISRQFFAPCQQELRYFQIAVVACDITNTIVQQDNLRLPISGVHVQPLWIHTFAV